jgi:hypothetical protein
MTIGGSQPQTGPLSESDAILFTELIVARVPVEWIQAFTKKKKILGCPCGDIGDNPKNSESIRIPEMIPYVVMNSSCSKISVTHNETIYSVVFHFTPLFSIPFFLLTCRKVLILL